MGLSCLGERHFSMIELGCLVYGRCWSAFELGMVVHVHAGVKRRFGNWYLGIGGLVSEVYSGDGYEIIRGFH